MSIIKDFLSGKVEYREPVSELCRHLLSSKRDVLCQEVFGENYTPQQYTSLTRLLVKLLDDSSVGVPCDCECHLPGNEGMVHFDACCDGYCKGCRVAYNGLRNHQEVCPAFQTELNKIKRKHRKAFIEGHYPCKTKQEAV